MSRLDRIGLLALVLLTCTDGFAQSAEEIKERLASSPQPSSVTTFYALREHRPAWVDRGRSTEAYAQFQRVRERLPEQGMDPEVYVLPAAPPGSASDIQITRTVLLLARHISEGRVSPETTYYGATPARERANLAELLHQAVEADAVDSLFNALEPQHPGYKRLKRGLSRYRRLQETGGFPKVTADSVLRLGDTLQAVTALRERLAVEGDLDRRFAGKVTIFDEDVDRAVRAFQERQGLDTDGIVGPKTFAALNVSLEYRIEQILLNLERWRWLPRLWGDRYVHINIAGFRLDVVEREETIMTMKVIVGRLSTRTPVFTTRITEVILAPYWYVPRSIAVNEIKPRLVKDPDFLRRNRIVQLPNGTLRQDPGPANPLGRMKFTIPNEFGVGLHDTPERHLFSSTVCAFSHGCMRVERPADLAIYLLQDPAWTRERIDEEVERWQSKTIPLSAPVPIYVLYWTTVADENGAVWFLPDIYGYDDRLQRSLQSLP